MTNDRECEQQLIQQVLAGNVQAQQAFFGRWRAYLFQYFGEKVHNAQDREELVASVMLVVFHSLPLFRGDCSLKTWLVTIARRRLVDFYRRKKVKTILLSAFPQLEEVASKALGPEEHALKQELKAEIKAVFATLSKGSAKILRLKYLEDWTVKRIAGLLRISPKAAESQLFRARQQFVASWNTTKTTHAKHQTTLKHTKYSSHSHP